MRRPVVRVAHLLSYPCGRTNTTGDGRRGVKLAFVLRDRRNLTDADILRCVEVLDRRRQQGERTDLTSVDVKLPRSSEITAATLGVSPAKVERARTVLDHAEPEVKQQVISGDKSINKAYTETHT